jgi:hypothetical protein
MKIMEVAMKRETLRSFALMILMLAFTSLTAQAQSAAQMKAQIPFNFIIGSQTLPAGDYTVRYINQDSGKTAILFKSADGRTSRIVQMMPAQRDNAQGKAILVFNQYGESYFLSEVWSGGDQYGAALPKSRMERNLNEMAKAEAKRVTVALSARR